MSINLEEIDFTDKEKLKRTLSYLFDLDSMLFKSIERSSIFIQLKNYANDPKNNLNMADYVMVQRAIKMQIYEFQKLMKHVNEYSNIYARIEKVISDAVNYLEMQIRALSELDLKKILLNAPQVIERTDDNEERELLRAYIAIMQNASGNPEAVNSIEQEIRVFYVKRNKEVLNFLQNARGVFISVLKELVPLLDSRFKFLKQHEKLLVQIFRSQDREIELLLREKKQNKIVLNIKKVFSKSMPQLIDEEKKVLSEFFEVMNKSSNEVSLFVRNIHNIEIFNKVDVYSARLALLIGVMPLGPLEVIAAPFWIMTGLTKVSRSLFLEGSKVYQEFKRAVGHETNQLPAGLFKEQELGRFSFA